MVVIDMLQPKISALPFFFVKCHVICLIHRHCFHCLCLPLQTTSVHALARQLLGSAYNNGVLELNASDSRGIDVS